MLGEAPLPDSSYSDDTSPLAAARLRSESESTTTPPEGSAPLLVGIVPVDIDGKQRVQVPAKKVEESEVSYSSIPGEGKGQSRRLRSTCGESIQEDIDGSPSSRPAEDPGGPQTGGSRPPSGRGGRARAFPQPWGARPGEEPLAMGPAAAMVPGAKLGLIQRRGTRWKVS